MLNRVVSMYALYVYILCFYYTYFMRNFEIYGKVFLTNMYKSLVERYCAHNNELLSWLPNPQSALLV